MHVERTNAGARSLYEQCGFVRLHPPSAPALCTRPLHPPSAPALCIHLTAPLFLHTTLPSSLHCACPSARSPHLHRSPTSTAHPSPPPTTSTAQPTAHSHPLWQVRQTDTAPHIAFTRALNVQHRDVRHTPLCASTCSLNWTPCVCFAWPFPRLKLFPPEAHSDPRCCCTTSN